MNNPGIQTLKTFLNTVKMIQPATYSQLVDSIGTKKGYGMLNRYIRFGLDNKLVEVTSTRRTHGRYPSNSYSLTEAGDNLLTELNKLK